MPTYFLLVIKNAGSRYSCAVFDYTYTDPLAILPFWKPVLPSSYCIYKTQISKNYAACYKTLKSSTRAAVREKYKSRRYLVLPFELKATDIDTISILPPILTLEAHFDDYEVLPNKKIKTFCKKNSYIFFG